MKVFRKDFKHGIVKLQVENLDDLWYLNSIIKENDLVRTQTIRRIKGKNDLLRGESERLTVTLTIKVEKAEFQPDSKVLRISGIIEECPEDLVSIGSHHTFNVEKNTILTIKKEHWFQFDLERLKEAEKSSLRPKLLIVVIEEGEAFTGLVRDSGIQYNDFSKSIGGKYDTKGRKERKEEFYHEVADFINQTVKNEGPSAIILAGVGFEKELFYKFLSEKYPDIYKKVVMENIGSHGRSGINEIMKRDVINKLLDSLNAAKDIQFVNKLLEHIGRGTGLGIYGINDIKLATDINAIELLLLTDDAYSKQREEFESIMNSVRKSHGIFHIVNHESEAGTQLNSLGGVAAILRFKIG